MPRESRMLGWTIYAGSTISSTSVSARLVSPAKASRNSSGHCRTARSIIDAGSQVQSGRNRGRKHKTQTPLVSVQPAYAPDLYGGLRYRFGLAGEEDRAKAQRARSSGGDRQS